MPNEWMNVWKSITVNLSKFYISCNETSTLFNPRSTQDTLFVHCYCCQWWWCCWIWLMLMGCCWFDGNSSFSFLSQNLDWWLTVIARGLPSRVDLPINLPVELSPIYDTNFPINIKIFISDLLGKTCSTAWQYIEYGILPKDINVLVKLNHMFVEYKFNFIYFVVINLHTETIYSQGKFDFDWVMRASSGSFHRPIGHFLVEHNV